MTVELTTENFEQEVLKSEKPVLVDFWAPWCGPCQIMGPILEELSDEVTDVKIGKLDSDQHPKIAQEYGILSIPTLKLFVGGKVVKEFVGVQQKDGLKAEFAKL
jgi:thioredoxin 1